MIEQLDKEYVLQTYPRNYVNFKRGVNATLFDENEKDYIDFTSGIGVVSVGHGNESVAKKIYEQKLPLGPIKFEKVNSQRVGASIKDLSFELPPGKIMTLSSQPLTHASLVLASIAPFQPIESGDITIDGIKVSDHQLNEYSQSVLYVLPWPKLLTGTLLENMTMFQAELEPQAIGLAEQLGLTQIIAQLPSGYSTEIGEQNKTMLNKGALKLIGLIRAIVQQPSILLLDEPMISLDADAQVRLTELLTRLKGEMTILITSHFESLTQISDVHINVEPQTFTEGGVNHE